ncbi:MAG TPA: DUF3237 domain-containing protein [Bryobacteraceae bacterium]|nr:DUF3237 domain-containing protein [Bryobacteraceae bacterium]
MSAAPGLEFIMEAQVTVGPALDVGRAPAGDRRIVPITGGTFEGPALRGRVLPGGADWQMIRADNTAELDARYTLETESGGLIYVRNRAIRHGSPDILRKLREGIPVDRSEYYFRTTPIFETAIPDLEWMTRSIFVGDGERFPDRVLIRFWRVL